MKKILLIASLTFSTLSFGQTLGEFISLELKSTSNIVTYVDFKGQNNQSADYVGRLDYTDGIGFSFKKWGNNFNLLEIKDNGDVNLFGKMKIEGDLSGINASFYGSYLGFHTNDNFNYNNQKIAHYGMTKINNENIVTLSGWGGLKFFTNGVEQMTLTGGNIGIGTTNPDEKLTVKGKIHAEEIIVDLAVPADYVFQKYYTGKSDLKADYEFPKLEEVEKFVKENNHLPGIPSAKEIQEKGLKVGEMNNLLLQKIEELTLLLIEQQKEIKELKETVNKK